MNIRKARDVAFQIGIKRGYQYSDDELYAAFHRLNKSQPEKENRYIIRGDRASAQIIWDYIGEAGPSEP